MTPAPLRRADTHIEKSKKYLTDYIEKKIAEAGNDYELAKKTGIPRTTIQSTLRVGGVLALRKLAYKLAGEVPSK